ncbi:kinesin motor domain-containing protein [Plasmopara halstedii]|uniref:Kinesin-like protein n=1 Tax=Plasmopara halstedii TaxID=4781 RepID=A0A0P1AUH4_PLAHL|nr:kinesin motor domain-containing protein [Plasmopara halstedii]CEG44976.1 kinesin motor domain-containing protein [Plasmopara halstedii]|eukprot:XP_024581345.1 kinesin motor domain-containing protein [Plasmopara halstedii]
MQKRVKVCIRVRPLTCNSDTNKSIECVNLDNAVVIDEEQQTIDVVTASGSGTSFRFDQILSPEVDQASVFRSVGLDVVDGALRGYNGCILAYGQTGAGKTFTISGGGSRRRYENRGIIARALSQVFQRAQQDANHSYVLRISYLEIYNDRLIDLLAPDESDNNRTMNDLAIQENARGQTFVRGLTKTLVSSEEQALDLVFQGETNRAVAGHALNTASTRSHCIFTLYLDRKRSALSSDLFEQDCGGDEAITSHEGEDDVVYSKLHVVDLAGSERMKKTMAEVGSTQANEACYINRSLTFLEQVVLALGSKQRVHIPFRQTPLTNLLKDSLGGNCRTLLIACIWPALTHAAQSLATLRFAARMRRLKTRAIVNVMTSNSGSSGSRLANEERIAYQNEIRRLREELALYNSIAGGKEDDQESNKYILENESSRRQQVTAFIADSEKIPPVQSLRQVHQLMQTFRLLFIEQNRSVIPTSSHKKTGGTEQIRALECHASSELKLPSLPTSSSSSRSSVPPAAILPSIYQNNEQGNVLQQQENRVTSDKELFKMFKSIEGKNPDTEAVRDLELAKVNLRMAKTQYTELVAAVNCIKLEIDEFAVRLQELCDHVTADQQHEENYADLRSASLLKLQDAKKRYRAAFEQLEEKKAEVGYLSKIKAQMLQLVAARFQAWKLQQENILERN